ncbi:MAG TPA: tetratricopeptide repeat protein, partial [Bacteroidia bacterium]|nr:tetratricopeptide repeat protein [Bacteroidia bacterium]
MNRLGISILFIIIMSLPGFAQNRAIDSLRTVLKTQPEDTGRVKTLNKLGEVLWRNNYFDTARICAQAAIELAQKTGYKLGIANAYRTLGIISDIQGHFQKALQYDTMALAINREIGNTRGIASNLGNMGATYEQMGNYIKSLECQNEALSLNTMLGNKKDMGANLGNMGNVYRNQGDYPRALESYLKALSICQETGNKRGIALMLGNIANVYSGQGNYTKALENYFKAVDMDKETGDKIGMANNMGNIGANYNDLRDFKNALNYDLKALDLYREIGNKNGVASMYENIGSVYSAQKNFPEALEYLNNALRMDKESGNTGGIALNLISMGSIFTSQKNPKRARSALDSALAISINMGEKESITTSYLALSILDSLVGDHKAAMADYKKAVVYRDSLINKANTEKSVQTAMNYEFDQKQAAEKAEQDKKDAVAEQERKKQNVIRNSFVAGFALMLVLAFFIFRGYRQKQSANIIITQQKEEVEKQKILVEEKNKDILDSIMYAKQLQDAILPPLSLIKKHLPESFVFYKPKDIVTGDFYWMERVTSLNLSQGRDFERSQPVMPTPLGEGKDEVILIAAADCTGHGVPGALVSVVCSNALNRAVKEFKIKEPGKILDKVRELVVETFSQKDPLGENKWEIQDGMDISLVAINQKALTNDSVEVQWSGANNVLWYVQNNEMKEIPA